MSVCSFFFFFNDTATTEIYTLSLHDALPILVEVRPAEAADGGGEFNVTNNTTNDHSPSYSLSGEEIAYRAARSEDRKSTRLNSSHANISYAVFCLKKKKNTNNTTELTPLRL